MKRSLLVVAVAAVVVASVCSQTAFAYYHPTLGQWLSRDPVRYRGGPNLYGYVASNPVRGRDPSGLWTSGQHGSLTRRALDAVLPSLKDPTPNADCKAYMRKTLTKANKDQDVGAAGEDLRRHYLRPPPVREEGAEERITNQQVADSAYQSYLASEAKTFADELAKGKDGCDAALKAQGRRVHSLEDFYRHAMRIGVEGFSVWADKVNPASPSPSDRDGVVPPTYVGEHPWWEPPMSGAEQDARYSATAQNTQGEYSANLPTWWKVCGCWCNQKALPGPAL